MLSWDKDWPGRYRRTGHANDLKKEAPTDPRDWEHLYRKSCSCQEGWNPGPDPSSPRVSSALVQGGPVSGKPTYPARDAPYFSVSGNSRKPVTGMTVYSTDLRTRCNIEVTIQGSGTTKLPSQSYVA
jgi:hypothetical protein